MPMLPHTHTHFFNFPWQKNIEIALELAMTYYLLSDIIYLLRKDGLLQQKKIFVWEKYFYLIPSNDLKKTHIFYRLETAKVKR